MSLSTKIFLGLGLGIATGIFLGEIIKKVIGKEYSVSFRCQVSDIGFRASVFGFCLAGIAPPPSEINY
jgi:Na+/H+-dicarboxylate symporter